VACRDVSRGICGCPAGTTQCSSGQCCRAGVACTAAGVCPAGACVANC
jgi:hypothetical protein